MAISVFDSLAACKLTSLGHLMPPNLSAEENVMSCLRAPQMITIGCLLIAISSSAQNISGSSSASTEQDPVSKAHDLLIQAVHVLEGTNRPTDAYTWGELAFAAARAKDVNLAIRAASASRKDSDSIARVAVVLMKDGRKKEAYEVIGLLAGAEPPITPELIAFETLIESQVASGDITGAKETLALMQKVAGPEPDNRYITDAQKKITPAPEGGNGKLDIKAALDSAKAIPDAAVRGQVLVLIGVKQMGNGDRAGSAETLRLGEQSLNQSKDPSGTGSGLLMLAKAEARLGDAKRALEIAKKIPRSDVCLLELNCAELALEQIAFEQARAGDVAGAFDTVQRLPSEDSKFDVLELIAKRQLSQHDSAAGLRTCQRILDFPVKAEFRKSSKYLEILLSTAEYQSEVGDGQLAEKTIARVTNEAQAIKDAGDRNRLVTDIAEAQARSGDFEDARKQVEQLTDTGAIGRMEAITLIAKAQAERKHFADAVETMASASARCSKSNPPPPACKWESYAFEGVLRALTRLGDEEDALNWANGRSSLSDQGKALVAVAQGLLDRVSPDDSETTKAHDEDELKAWETFWMTTQT
jgi:tetratricopeptide (TPR) repeat protein